MLLLLLCVPPFWLILLVCTAYTIHITHIHIDTANELLSHPERTNERLTWPHRSRSYVRTVWSRVPVACTNIACRHFEPQQLAVALLLPIIEWAHSVKIDYEYQSRALLCVDVCCSNMAKKRRSKEIGKLLQKFRFKTSMTLNVPENNNS